MPTKSLSERLMRSNFCLLYTSGLYECVKYMTGLSHTDPEAEPFALEVMQHMNDACKKWKAKENIDFSLYGTPLERDVYKRQLCYLSKA